MVTSGLAMTFISIGFFFANGKNFSAVTNVLGIAGIGTTIFGIIKSILVLGNIDNSVDNYAINLIRFAITPKY